MKRLDGVLKGFAAFLFLSASLFYAYVSYRPAPPPDPSSLRLSERSAEGAAPAPAEKLPAPENTTTAGEGRSGVGSSAEKNPRTERSPDSFGKDDIVRKMVVYEQRAGREEIVRFIKKELRSVYREAKNKDSPFLLGYLIIRDADGRELGRGVVRPDSTYVIVIEGKIVKEGSVDEL